MKKPFASLIGSGFSLLLLVFSTQVSAQDSLSTLNSKLIRGASENDIEPSRVRVHAQVSRGVLAIGSLYEDPSEINPRDSPLSFAVSVELPRGKNFSVPVMLRLSKYSFQEELFEDYLEQSTWLSYDVTIAGRPFQDISLLTGYGGMVRNSSGFGFQLRALAGPSILHIPSINLEAYQSFVGYSYERLIGANLMALSTLFQFGVDYSYNEEFRVLLFAELQSTLALEGFEYSIYNYYDDFDTLFSNLSIGFALQW